MCVSDLCPCVSLTLELGSMVSLGFPIGVTGSVAFWRRPVRGQCLLLAQMLIFECSFSLSLYLLHVLQAFRNPRVWVLMRSVCEKESEGVGCVGKYGWRMM